MIRRALITRQITGHTRAYRRTLALLLITVLSSFSYAQEVDSQPFGIFLRQETAFSGVSRPLEPLQRERVTQRDTPSETSSLHIRSEPDGADVFIDGRYYGRTPVILRDQSPATRVLRLTLDGYYDARIEISSSESTATEYFIQLARRSAYLVIDGLVEDQAHSGTNAPEFFLDGRSIRPGIHQLPFGSYEVRIRRFGFHEERRRVELYPDTATVVSARLRPAAFEVMSFSSSPRRFNPMDPGRLGVTRIRLEVTAPGLFQLEVLDADRSLVRNLGEHEAQDFTSEFLWDGTDSDGHVAPDGRYYVVLSTRIEDELRRHSEAVDIDRSRRVRMRSPYSVQAGTAITPGLTILAPGRLQIAGAVGYHQGPFESEGLEHYPSVIHLRVGLSSRLELGALAGVQLYNDPDYHRYYGALALQSRLLDLSFGPLGLALGAGLRGSLANHNNSDMPALRPDPYGASSGVAVGIPIEFSLGAVLLTFAPELGAEYPAARYRAADETGIARYARLASSLSLELSHLNLSLSWALRGHASNSDNALTREPADSVFGEMQVLIPRTVAFLHLGVGLDYNGDDRSYHASVGIGVLR